MNLMRSIIKGVLIEDIFFFLRNKVNSALEKQVMEVMEVFCLTIFRNRNDENSPII